MCSAATSLIAPILMGGLSMAQNVASQKAQIAQQKAQQEAYTQQKNAEWEIAKRQADDEAHARQAAAVINLMQLQHREQEINTAATAEKTEIAMSAQKAKALAKLGALEAGASGLSADRLIASVDQEASRRTANVEATREHQIGAAETDKIATVNQARTMPIYRNPVTGQPIAGVNYATAALSGLSTGLGNMNWSSFSTSTNACKPVTSTCRTYNPCGTSSRFV